MGVTGVTVCGVGRALDVFGTIREAGCLATEGRPAVSEYDQPTAGGSIDYAGIVHGPDGTGSRRPGRFDADPLAVRLLERVDFL